MAYVIKRLNPDATQSHALSSGQTRWQVTQALRNLGLIAFNADCPVQLPKFGKVVAYCHPSGSFTISHI